MLILLLVIIGMPLCETSFADSHIEDEKISLDKNFDDKSIQVEKDVFSPENLVNSDNESFTFSKEIIRADDDFLNYKAYLSSESLDESIIEKVTLKLIPTDQVSYDAINDFIKANAGDYNGSSGKNKLSKYNSVKLYSTVSYKVKKVGNVEYTRPYSFYGGYAKNDKNVTVSNQKITYGMSGLPLNGIGKSSGSITKYNNSMFWSYYAPSDWYYLAPTNPYRVIGVRHSIKIKRNGYSWTETLQNNI